MPSYVRCRKCTMNVLFTELIRDDEGQVVCIHCYRKLKSMRESLQEEISTNKPEDKNNSERLNYYCKSCGYKFSRRTGFSFTKCPNCGEETVGELNL